MKKLNEYDEFLDERFGWMKPKYTKEKIKELISKAKILVPQDKMQSFIIDNKDKIEDISKMITDEQGDVDYGKVRDFIKANIKK